jgi:hypothetical protein
MPRNKPQARLPSLVQIRFFRMQALYQGTTLVGPLRQQRSGLWRLRENWKETAGPSTTLRSGRDDKGG